MASKNKLNRKGNEMESKLTAAEENYVIGLLNAAYDKVVEAKNAHARYRCEVSLNDLRQAERELKTMKRIAYEATQDALYKLLED